jgi:CHAD domain-containing protein
MAEAVRKILREQLEVMLANEAGSRVGDDIEHVHDMRVAVRRMRAAFRLFGGYFQPQAIKGFEKDLRKTGRALGTVRDLDVFNREAMRYLRLQPKPRRHDLDSLLNRWHEQREAARLELVDYLDSQRYQRFLQEFGDFVQTPGAGVERIPEGEPQRLLVRDVLSSTVWQLYETAWAYDRVLEEAPVTTLHALRIDCKYLRYTLEFFESLLGPEAPWLIREVTALQDHLGDIQDAEVAKAILADVMGRDKPGSPKLPAADRAHIEAYGRFRLDEQHELLATLRKAWARVDSTRFRRRLANGLLALGSSTRASTA